MEENKEPQQEQLTRPEKFFKSISSWIGTGIFLTALYYEMERGVEVNLIVFAVGGILMGAGKALEMARGIKS